MYTFLLILLILDSLVLIAAVLLQSGKGGGVAASFGGASSSADAFIGTRQAGNLLRRPAGGLAGSSSRSPSSCRSPRRGATLRPRSSIAPSRSRPRRPRR